MIEDQLIAWQNRRRDREYRTHDPFILANAFRPVLVLLVLVNLLCSVFQCENTTFYVPPGIPFEYPRGYPL
ncbi:MAG: hypothetical protein JRE28_13610 [Deltaproteobacteria bacterium]|nr:hypothetical protein [Deltaproteobacteria bacterium]